MSSIVYCKAHYLALRYNVGTRDPDLLEDYSVRTKHCHSVRGTIPVPGLRYGVRPESTDSQFSTENNMTLFSVENSKSVNLVLTPYGNRRIGSYSLQNVRSWYVLSSRLTGLVPYYLQFVGVLSPQYNVRCTIRGNWDTGIPKVDVN